MWFEPQKLYTVIWFILLYKEWCEESFEKCEKLCHIQLKKMIIQVRIMIHNTDNVWSGVHSLCQVCFLLTPPHYLPAPGCTPHQRDDHHLASHQINDQQLASQWASVQTDQNKGNGS